LREGGEVTHPPPLTQTTTTMKTKVRRTSRWITVKVVFENTEERPKGCFCIRMRERAPFLTRGLIEDYLFEFRYLPEEELTKLEKKLSRYQIDNSILTLAQLL
jgi:hypothetical protein